MSIEEAKRVIEIEAAAVATLKDRIDRSFQRAVDLIYGCKGRVVVVGMGKSGIVGRKIAATLTSTGTPAFYLHSTEALHGDSGILQRDDVAIAISKSGQSEELQLLVPLLKRLDIPLIAMTGNPRSWLAQKSDVVLDTTVEKEACPYDLTPTTSTTVTMVLGDALAVALLKKRNFGPRQFAVLHPGGSLGRKLICRVEDLMHKNGAREALDASPRGEKRSPPFTIGKEELAAEAVPVMERHIITQLVVVDASSRWIDLLKAGVI
ncbi:MAG: hypothetical protein B1H40_05075 [Candidatus Latescibacteria bacterium 4484_181]|nr:MAG: hypothetical protein B1H40_05075 [Candidatus Latescibacteria bacterium 4484_181]